MPKPQIKAELTLQGAQFVRQLKGISGQLSTFSSSISRIGGLIGTVFVTGAVARAINRTAALSDELGKLARQTDFSTDAIQKYRFVAEKVNVSQSALDKSLVAFTRRLGAFVRDGGGPAAAALKELGISQAEVINSSPEKALALVSDRLALVHERTRQVNIADGLFSESGRRMNLVIGEGAKAFEQQAAALGKAKISQQTIADAEAYADALVDFGRASDALTASLVGKLLPALTELFEALSKLINSDLDGFVKQMNALLSGDFSKSEKLNAALEKRLFILEKIKQLEATPATRSLLGIDLPTGRDEKLALERAKLQDVNTDIAALRAALAPSAPTQSTASVPGVSSAQAKSNPFLFKPPTPASSADPLAALQNILDGFAAQERAIGEVEVANASRKFQALLATIRQPAEDAAFAAELDPESFGKKRKALELAVESRRRELAVLGQVEAKDRELLRLQTAMTRLVEARASAEQEALGQGEVANATRALEGRIKGLRDQERQAQQALAIGDLRVDEQGRPTQLPGTRLLRQLDVLNAQRNTAQAQFQQTGAVEFQDTVARLDEQIRSLQISFDTLDFKTLEAQFVAVGEVISNTLNTALNTMVQGLLLGTQSMSDIWRNFLRNMAASLLNQGIQGATSGLIKGGIGLALGLVSGGGGASGIAAATARGTANPALFGPGFASGGSFVVGGNSGIDQNLIRFRASRGERVTVETPEQVRAREGGGRPVVNIINHTGQPTETKESRAPDGSFRLDVMIGQAGSSDVARRGPLAQTLESVYGLRRAGGPR